MILIRSKFFSEHRIGGVYSFPPSTTDQTIIEHILSDFALKLYGIMKLYADPKIGCQSLSTYQIFDNFWGIDSDREIEGEEIYSEIPSDIIAAKISELSGGKISEEEAKHGFGGGEFPIVKIWKNEDKDGINATYDIMR